MFTVIAVGKDPLLDGVFAYGPYKSIERAREIYDLCRDPSSAYWHDPDNYEIYEPRTMMQPERKFYGNLTAETIQS